MGKVGHKHFPGVKTIKGSTNVGGGRIFIKIITTLPRFSRVRVCLALLRKEMWITGGLLFFDAFTFYFFLRATSFPCRPIKRPLVKPVLTRWKNGSRIILVMRAFSFFFFFLFHFLFYDFISYGKTTREALWNMYVESIRNFRIRKKIKKEIWLHIAVL